MTPLAQRIVRELIAKKKDRTFRDHCGLLSHMDDIHSFECSEVAEAAHELLQMPAEGEQARVFGMDKFLPAPKTWIEWRPRGGDIPSTGDDNLRYGVLLEEAGDTRVRLSFALGSEILFGSVEHAYLIELGTGHLWRCGSGSGQVDPRNSVSDGFVVMAMMNVHAFLAMINTPRIIGRVTHTPHAGLERRLLAARPIIGKFPLHAWTEIKLSVTPPVLDEREFEAHLTGQRALHFVRCHLRIRCGLLEMVKAHWRGDASLGIVQSRYVVTPGSGEA